MSTHARVAPVRKSVFVDQPVDRAFALFTDRMDEWWPLRKRSVGGESAEKVVFEPREGGRIYERMGDGTIAYWGEVLVWEPPRRFVLAWEPSPESPAPTEVEVTFTEERGGTRVELEHGGWERLGERAELARTEYESGWDAVLGRYAAAGRENGLAIASLILGIASLVPLLGLLASPFAIVFGIVGSVKARRGARHGGLATAGIALGAVTLLAWALLLLLITPVSTIEEGATGEIVP